MKTFYIHVTLGDRFEDLYIKARNEKEALEKAKKVTTLKHRFTNFII